MVKTNSFILVIINIVSIYCSETSKEHRCNINGKYELFFGKETTDYYDYLKAMDYKREAIDSIMNTQSLFLEINKTQNVKGNTTTTTTISITETRDGVSSEHSFIPGKEFDLQLQDGRKVKAVAVLDESHDRITRTLKLSNWEAKQVAEFSTDGVVVYYYARGRNCVLEFRRIQSAH